MSRTQSVWNSFLLGGCLLALFTTLTVPASGQRAKTKPGKAAAQSEWVAYGRDPGGARHSPLTEINRDNVTKLKVAWTYRTGDVSDGKNTRSTSAFQVTPLMVDGTLYLSTPFNRVIALDPETGRERWTYDPKLDLKRGYDNQLNSRGISTWVDSRLKAGRPGRRRIFIGTVDARLIALDAVTGLPCADFGEKGQVDLSPRVTIARPGEYGVTSPPAIINDLVVVGSAIGDNQRVDAPSGVVRAFDARTGRLRWAWEALPPKQPKEGADDGKAPYQLGTANVWSVISADPERDLLFLPTGNTSPDYYGGQRHGSDYYSSSVVALRGSTGRVVWHFQTVHHDIWDYDIPAQPALITVRRNGRNIPAVAVATKVGHLFVLHRETGRPIFPVEERPAPKGDVPGEEYSPTQPIPTAPRALVPQKITPEDAWGLTAADVAACREQIKSLRNDGLFTPPSLQGSIVYPGDVGGMNWSGMSFDPARGLIITNTNRFVRAVTLIPRDQVDTQKIAEWRSKLIDFEIGRQTGTPYVMRREFLFRAIPRLTPCNPPPWGTLLAVDLADGSVKWEVPLGQMPEMAGVPGSDRWGSLNLGGSMVTAGGLIFIGAARDDYIRAFDVETGRELWKGSLPAGGQAMPMTYRVREGGKQYVVICAGGHGRLRTIPGDYVVAFALP
jgi:quinoprotein glucose dehydrogenase